jgi:hypothetical protein
MDKLKLDNKWDAQVVAGILAAWAGRGIANVGALRMLPFEERAVSDVSEVLRFSFYSLPLRSIAQPIC